MQAYSDRPTYPFLPPTLFSTDSFGGLSRHFRLRYLCFRYPRWYFSIYNAVGFRHWAFGFHHEAEDIAMATIRYMIASAMLGSKQRISRERAFIMIAWLGRQRPTVIGIPLEFFIQSSSRVSDLPSPCITISTMLATRNQCRKLPHNMKYIPYDTGIIKLLTTPNA